MPVYEYACDHCGRQCEVIQRFDEEPLSCCPDCGGHMHKLISHTSFILKGTGWYATDYASAERKKSREAEFRSESKTDAKKESKADAVTKN
jgi:putative FmdB family regulatory protein